MDTLNRTELDKLERRELQLTILAAAYVLVQAAGLAVFMYPLVFLQPVGIKWSLRVAFFGFCALTLLFVGYLLDRQRTVRKLKEQILAELERNISFFFFQAEDGIRDDLVTGVQTCALPIYELAGLHAQRAHAAGAGAGGRPRGG